MDIKSLRKKHPRLIYWGFDFKKENNDLILTFGLELEPNIKFYPKLKIKNISQEIINQISTKETLDPQLNKLFFHLGMAEIPSYFKVACPEEIVVKHQGQITEKNKSFWHDLLIKGLGEFYYQNKIDFTKEDFIKIKLEKTSEIEGLTTKFNPPKNSSILVPVGGGKDSSTVLAMIEERKLPYDIFLLAPHSAAAKEIALILQKNGYCKNIIEAERSIDPTLLEMNKQGYLNGHTPFSSYLAFASSSIAYLYGQENILLGNEASSEEENLIYLGQKINHQYSKSLDFEKKFSQYSQEQLFSEKNDFPKYLSLLRSLSELEITQRLCQFATKDKRFEKILEVLRSCNVGQKKGIWCQDCPKCAFVYTMFSAFLEEEIVSNKIFSENLFAKKSLEQTFLDLAGFGNKKPFECVGTFAEVRQALILAYKKSKSPPMFLKQIKQKIAETELMDKLSKKSVLILGMGREGTSTLDFLRKKFPNKQIAIADEHEKSFSKDQNIKTYFGKNYLEKIDQYEIIIKTAGIPITTKEIAKAIAKGSEILSNTQIFFTLCQGTIIGITGTKGKSTTSKLTYEILRDAGKKVILLGNIGDAPLNQLDKISKDTLIVDELSCHQLAELTDSPHVGVVLDIKSEHLDYYKDFASYFEAKTAIARYQKENDYLIYNPKLSGSNQMAKLSIAKKLRHDLKQDEEILVYKKNDKIFYQNEEIIAIKDIPLLGEHNLYNVMPAILVGKLFEATNHSIEKTIKNFRGLPHRIEFVTEINGVKYFNDSISTNPHSAMMAIRSFAKGSVILIAGGYERNQDFSELAQIIAEYKVKLLIALPTTGARLIEFTLGNNPDQLVQKVETIAEAVDTAHKQANSGDIVLLSPASASFNSFANYEERGKAFCEAAKKIKEDEQKKESQR